MGLHEVTRMSSNLTATVHGGAIIRLAEANRFISLAIDSLCDGETDDAALFAIKRAMKSLGIAETQIELAVAPVPVVETVTDRRFADTGLPEGFMTILGFITAEVPNLLEFMPNPAEDIQADHEVIATAMIGSGKSSIQVPSSLGMLEAGHPMDVAYPVEFLRPMYA